MRLTEIALTFILLSLIVFAGCSSSDNTPLSPETPNEFPASGQTAGNNHLLGMWDAEFDIESNTVQINPHRGTDAHFNITLLIPGPQIDILSFDPIQGIVEAEITIENPYAFNAYDIRVIIYTDTLGHMLMNPDGWTDLYENPGGLPINPFKAFNMGEANRVFAGLSDASETLLIYLPGCNPNVTFALEGSFPGNCEEPYKMENFSHDSLYNITGSYAQMQVDIFDWQDDVESVFLYCPVITGLTVVPLSFNTGNTWTGMITNTNGVGVGSYTGYVIGYSSGISLYDQVTIYVGEEATEPGWVQAWGGSKLEKCTSIYTHGDMLYITGVFSTTVDFDPGPGIVNKTSAGAYDCFIVKYTDDGTFQWVRAWGGSDYDGVSDIAIDASDNIFVCGSFRGTCDFDPGGGVFNVTSAGYNDAYLLKLDPYGDLHWVKTWGGTDFDNAAYVEVTDTRINIFGRFKGESDFDPGPGTVIRTSNGSDDVFLSFFDLNGNLLYNGTWGSSKAESHSGMELNQDNGVFVSGWFEETVDFDLGPGTTEATSNGEADCFIAEYNSSLELQSLKTFGGLEDDFSANTTTDSQGNLIIGGAFSDEVDFDPSSGEDIHTSNGGYDAFISKYDSAGNYVFTKTFGNIFMDNSYDVATDSANNIIIAGGFWGTCDFDPGPGVVERTAESDADIYVLKLNSSGIFNWIYTASGSFYNLATNVTTDESGYIYTVGYFWVTVDFEPGPGITERTSNGDYDAFALKLNPSGEW
jgi:hypothetical protein